MSGSWFAPKTFGYGVTPAKWQGWAATAIYIAAIILIALAATRPDMLRRSARVPIWLALASGLAATAVFVVGAYVNTDGDWQWR